MSFTKNITKFSGKINIDTKTSDAINTYEENSCDSPKSCTYAVTTSNKSIEENKCSNQRSFISIHSTDECQIALTDSNVDDINDLNVEIISLNTVFPSTSEESLSDENCIKKALKTAYVPSCSKSATGSNRVKGKIETLRSSDVNIAKNTMYCVGSNPGEPKICYDNSKVSKTMKKLMRKKDKHKTDKSNNTEQSVGKLLTRGILKEVHCALECTGDSTNAEKDIFNEEALANYVQKNFNKHADKNVKFNTKVVIIHFTGDICLGQSVETLSKEKDQQERNSELRKTFLTKYNELWSKQK